MRNFMEAYPHMIPRLRDFYGPAGLLKAIHPGRQATTLPHDENLIFYTDFSALHRLRHDRGGAGNREHIHYRHPKAGHALRLRGAAFFRRPLCFSHFPLQKAKQAPIPPFSTV